MNGLPFTHSRGLEGPNRRNWLDDPIGGDEACGDGEETITGAIPCVTASESFLPNAFQPASTSMPNEPPAPACPPTAL